jgi:thiamine monophosphate synthase
MEGLARAAQAARAAGIPLVAIGGIDLERAPEIARHADFGAVISALLPPGGDLAAAGARAVALQRALESDR